jgi:PAS domain S-box-containing protein
VRAASCTLFWQAGPGRRFDVAVVPVYEGEFIVGFAGSAVDITERVQAERKLQVQLAFTAQLLDVSPLPSSVTDLAGRYVLVNKAWEAFTGRQRADVLGQPSGTHLNPELRALNEQHDRVVVTTGLPARYETKFPRHDGSLRDAVVNKMLVPGEGGVPKGILSTVVDVTEFREAERATREARDAAQESSRAKSEFIANISHELRTPLQSIIGFSELGTLRGRGQDKLVAMFGDILASGRRMLALVNDLLDVSKIESSAGTIHLERTDLRPLLREVARELEPLLAAKWLELDMRLSPAAIVAKVDPLRYQQVVRNVLANAIKFAGEGTQIVLEAGFDDDGGAHVSVRDHGPGIPPQELDKIFEAFVQSSETKDGSGGTGLGLAICRAIVSAHGGSIDAENMPDGGSRFHIRLPPRVAGETRPAELAG